MHYQLVPIRAFSDNYIWLVHDATYALVVDPGDHVPPVKYLQAHNLKLAAVLITHHHHDHIGGLAGLLHHCADANTLVTGPDDPRIDNLNRIVGEGDAVHIDGLNLDFKVLEVPAHTRTHIAFYNDWWLFPGDTIFSAGCGRLFEGTPGQLQNSLDKLAALPAHLLMCCAHEYSAANCRFALTVDPYNQALQQRCQEVDRLRAAGLATLPVTLAGEIAYNPFLRTREPAVIQAALARAEQQPGKVPDRTSPDQIMAVIRSWKDQF